MRLKLLITLSLLITCAVPRASERLCFDHYKTKDGLCCDFVLGIGQDRNGFIWTATQDGVSRFDGTNFKNYSKKRGGLMRNNVSCLSNTPEGDILFGGDNGMLQSYDWSTDTFVSRRFPELMEKYVKSVTGFSRLRDGRSLLLTTSGIFPYDTLRSRFSEDSLLTGITSQLLVQSFYEDRFGDLWVGSFDGLHLFSAKGEELKFYTLSKDKAPASSILELDSSRVLVSTNMGGVWLYDIPEHGLPVAKELNTPFKNISVMLKDAKGRVWFGTWGDGLWRMDRFGSFVEVKSYGGEEDLQKVHTIFEDSDHSIWIGTQVNGVFRYQAENSSKIFHSSEMGYPNVDASCFMERPDGNIFVGSDGSGAYLVSGEGKFMQNLDGFSCMGRSILSFCRWRGGESLVSSWFGGIGVVSADGRVSPLKYDGLENTVNSSKCVRHMRNGDIWVATQGDGVYVRQADGVWEKKSFVVNDEVTDLWIDDMEEAPDGTMWVLSPYNAWRCDSTGMRFYAWKNDPNASELCIFVDGACDGEGNLLVASNYGIIEVSKQTGALTLLDYLPTAKYVSVYFDRQGFLWCDGTAGIYRVNLKERTFRMIPLPVDKYGKLFFQPRAIYESSKGNVFFGCANGFITLNPSEMGSSGKIDFLAWTQAIGKKEDGQWNMLELRKDRLRLDGENVETRISFDVVSLSGMDVVCRYRLKGWNDDWKELGGKRDVVLDHLPSGKYELELSVYKAGNEKNATQLNMTIIVSTVWWRSWWFITLVVLSLLALLYWVYGRMKRPVVITETAISNEPTEEKEAVEDSPQQPAVDPFMAQVMEVIERNYMNPEFSVEELAKEMSTSKSTLIRRLKPLTEQTPVEMIGVHRLKKADEMLRTTNLPVKEVAFTTGFSSPYYFSRKYKEYFGYPPSQKKEKDQSDS
jgi:ligand-binding sensor domain-containing protein/AraC-like DNA-binding protein